MADNLPGMPGSPQSWLEFLEPQLDEQEACITPYQDYYDGKQKLQMATAKFREAFSRFFPPMANNWMQIVVDAPVSRLTVQGFRFNTDGSSPTARRDGAPVQQINGHTPPWELDADEGAWETWQANNLDSISRMVHTDAVKLGCSYVLVQPPDLSRPTRNHARITPEHACNCFVYCDPEDRKYRLAAIKRWQSDFDGMLYANIYLPDAVYKFRAEPRRATGDSGILGPNGQKLIGTRKTEWEPFDKVPNPMGVVPLVPIENRPDLLYGGRSDLENAMPIQDAINKFCLDMQVSGEFHAFPQRYAIGMARAVDDKGRELSGREMELYLSAARVIRAEDKDTKFGQFEQGNVDNYLKPIEEYVDHLAAQTQTPLYYLKGKMAAMSADAMHAQDQGLVDRCNGKILSFSDGWEEVMRTAMLAEGDQSRGNAVSAEVIWADPESKSLAVLVQAAMIMRTQLSVPVEMCWEMLGWSPQKIRLARDIMGLPPGGAVPAAVDPVSGALVLGTQGMAAQPGAEEPNDANQHPGNQPGGTRGQASQQVKSSTAAIRASLPASRTETPG